LFQSALAELRITKRPLKQLEAIHLVAVLIPMKVDSDSDLIPVTRSDGMPVTFGAQRRRC